MIEKNKQLIFTMLIETMAIEKTTDIKAYISGANLTKEWDQEYYNSL